MRIVLDMNISPAWIPAFAQHGIIAAHWRSIGNPVAQDSEIMAWAAANDHIVFTHDLDFAMILAALGSNKPSVVQLRNPDIDPGKEGALVSSLLLQYQTEFERGALLSIEPHKHRVRLLPLNRQP